MLNRTQLFASLHRCITAAVGSGRLLGLLVLRTQRVREFSLLFGYEAGERIADAMRAAVVAAVRPDDEVLQIGECDFAILLPDVRNRQHVALAAAKLVRVLQAPLDAHGHEMQAIGRDRGRGLPAGQYRSGPAVPPCGQRLRCRCHQWRTLRAVLHRRNSPMRSHTATCATRSPPTSCISSCSRSWTCMAEAPLGWNPCRAGTTRELGAIPPDAFIRVAEQTGLIGELTRWNLNVALRHVRGGARFRASVLACR